MTYKPYDREEKLGPPPWSLEDPKVVEWEEVHGHDVRLQCQLDPDCLVLEARMDAVIEAARALIANRIHHALLTQRQRGGYARLELNPDVVALRDALAALDGSER